MRRRIEVLAATALCVLGIGIAAASLPASFAFDPPSESSGSGPGGSVLVALLFVLVRTLAGLLGIPLSDQLGAPASGSGLLGLVLAVARAVVPYLPAAVAVLAALAVVLLARALWSGQATVTLGSSRPIPGGLGGWTTETGRDRGTESGPRREWPRTEPGDPIGDAWVEFVERSGVESPATRTPSEVARTAVEDGMNERAVERLTAAFVETRYGPARPTNERCRRATAALDDVDA